MRKEINFDRFIRGLIAVLIVVALGWLLHYLSAVLIPFFVAWVIAYLLYPVVRFLQRRCRVRNRLVAILITLLLSCGLLVGFFYLVVPPMIDECGHLKDVALEYIERGTRNPNIPAPLQEFLQRNVNEHKVDELLRQKDVVTALKNTVPKVWSVLLSTAGIIINLAASLIALFYLLFILTDYERYADGWIHYVPRSRRAFAARLVGDVQRGMSGYFRGQALIALSNCVMFSVGFVIIGFPMPVALGCFIGVISFVPYLQVVGFVPAAVLALLVSAETGENFWWLIGGVLLVYIVVQVLQDTIFTPRIMGKIMGLRPAVILLSLSVWGYAFGIIGLIVALPVTTLLISYYKRYVVGEEPEEELPGPDEAGADDTPASSRAAQQAASLAEEAPKP